jgi:hypothetical protein
MMMQTQQPILNVGSSSAVFSVPSCAPLKKVKEVQFGVLSPDEIVSFYAE